MSPQLKRLFWIKGPTPIESHQWYLHGNSLILDEVLDVDETIHDDSEATALIKATNAGSFKTVKLLLLCGANPKQV